MTIHDTSLMHAKKVVASAAHDAYTELNKYVEKPVLIDSPELVKTYMELVVAVYQTNRDKR